MIAVLIAYVAGTFTGLCVTALCVAASRDVEQPPVSARDYPDLHEVAIARLSNTGSVVPSSHLTHTTNDAA